MSNHPPDVLKQQIQQQLSRLLKQLQDVENDKEMLDSEEEYLEIKRETLQQLEEFQQTLNQIGQNDEILRDDIRSFRMAVRAACVETFKTLEIIQMFAQQNTNQIKEKLSSLETSFRLHKIPESEFISQKTEILGALQKLNSPLTQEQEQFLKKHMNSKLKEFIENDSFEQTVLSNIKN
ncbi:hypothetical protein C9374_002555 [Naegleria lovaniensis]|uniref:Beta-catenin-interacting ICAT domain-containing protein n=1 Tax=Naegleria lovaniensis TaxID=51637 RepID=A0AA88KLS2_NAELO|nr:uncharacterized protein C9374_002555 [Naegleria lovaniensis]KAG2386109.1 hypothetical protein C9374_002555 [Naegleria lovaniensis]